MMRCQPDYSVWVASVLRVRAWLQVYANNPDNYLVPDNAWPFFKQFSLP